MDRVKLIALVSIGIGTAVLLLKAGAWWLTGSSALYSDALESVVNVAASMVAAGALFYATRPADKNHPYGHDKAEFFAAVLVGVLIIVAALSIFENALAHWRHPQMVQEPWLGLSLNVAATVLNGLWAVVLGAAGRQSRSAALKADAKHLWSDVVTSLGVLAGVGIVLATGIGWLDSALAIAVGLNVLWSGWGVMRESVGGLMDEAPSEGVMERTRELLNRTAEGAIEAHDLRMRLAGRTTYLEFHLVVPGAMQVADAHVICDRVEAALKAETPGLVVTIHVEPEGKAKHTGVLVL
ncbi:MAG: cation diffusion facilitator family transporter [Acetobacteraceae bacterium]|nr:cation diffusion facilitator family transporter [Acetobacteraceae bacterium]